VQAVVDIGLEDVTMKRVADHLGVSVPGLYHHVSGRDDLLRMAAERSLSRLALPEDGGQRWHEWLREWARYIRSSMGEPELVQQYVAGAVPRDRIIDSVDLVLRVLLREGFSPEAGNAAWELVANLALGGAINEIREQEAIAHGGSTNERLRAALADQPADALPAIRALVESRPELDRDAVFEDHLTTVLVGIAVRNDLDAAAVFEPAPSVAPRRTD
jgi:AcrR family transcriptional regulator